MRKNFPTSFMQQLASVVFIPVGTLGLCSFIFLHLSFPTGKRTTSEKGSTVLLQALHFMYLSENAFSYETLCTAFWCLVTLSCMWSQRRWLVFPLQKYSFVSKAFRPSQIHSEAALSLLNMPRTIRLYKRTAGLKQGDESFWWRRNSMCFEVRHLDSKPTSPQQCDF